MSIRNRVYLGLQAISYQFFPRLLSIHCSEDGNSNARISLRLQSFCIPMLPIPHLPSIPACANNVNIIRIFLLPLICHYHPSFCIASKKDAGQSPHVIRREGAMFPCTHISDWTAHRPWPANGGLFFSSLT